MIVKPFSTRSELAELNAEVCHYHRRAWYRRATIQRAIERRWDGWLALFRMLSYSPDIMSLGTFTDMCSDVNGNLGLSRQAFTAAIL